MRLVPRHDYNPELCLLEKDQVNFMDEERESVATYQSRSEYGRGDFETSVTVDSELCYMKFKQTVSLILETNNIKTYY